MATYAISDIHGALGECKTLLKKVNFRYDGSDTLFFLGDYGDWGGQSIETFLFLMELQEQYPFVHCLMGNHDRMFLDAILADYSPGDLDERAENWIYDNRGLVTWLQYLELPQEKKKALRDWLTSLPYSAQAQAEGKWYMLAHAYPYHYDMDYSAEEARRRGHDALWRRLMLRENPFGDYSGGVPYDKLICGHTITDYFFQKLRYEKQWPFRKPAEYKRNRIFHAERFIDIDCGAKCMDCGQDNQDVLQVAAMRAQLACLRLEDEEEFYVHRPALRLPENLAENLAELKTAEIRIPQVRLPDLGLPEHPVQEVRTVQEKLANLGTKVSGAVSALFDKEERDMPSRKQEETAGRTESEE